MSYTPHQLNLITKTILKLMPAIAFCSSSVAFAEPVTKPGELDNRYTNYEIETSTVLDNNSAINSTLNINGGLINLVNNAGTIKNSAGGALVINNMEGELKNAGLIDGKTYGIEVVNGASININNDKDAIISGNENAVVAETSFGLENKGTIKSQSSNAIQINNGTATIKNLSSISSEKATGIIVDGEGKSTISNAGKIKGQDYAIKFESTKQNSLILLEGSQLEGDVLSTNSKSNTLLLKDSGTEDSNFVGLNKGDGFASLNMVGKEWTLSGTIDLLGNGDKDENDKVLQVTSGTLTLTGTVNNAGGTTINEGAALQLGDATHTAAFTSDAVTNNGMLVFNQSGNSTFSSDISGIGKLTKSDASTLTLDGIFSYTGGTELNGGTTLVAKDSALGTTTAPARININNSATLASAGTITGNVNIMAGGTLAAGMWRQQAIARPQPQIP